MILKHFLPTNTSDRIKLYYNPSDLSTRTWESTDQVDSAFAFDPQRVRRRIGEKLAAIPNALGRWDLSRGASQRQQLVRLTEKQSLSSKDAYLHIRQTLSRVSASEEKLIKLKAAAAFLRGRNRPAEESWELGLAEARATPSRIEAECGNST